MCGYLLGLPHQPSPVVPEVEHEALCSSLPGFGDCVSELLGAVLRERREPEVGLVRTGDEVPGGGRHLYLGLEAPRDPSGADARIVRIRQ